MILTQAQTVISDSRYHLQLLKELDPLRDHAVVIVPEQYTLQAERDLMAGLGTEGLFHIEVTSFKRIWQKQSILYGFKHKEAMTELGKKMVLRQILSDQDHLFKLYKGAYRNMGFLEDLAQTVTELRQNAVRPAYLEALADLAPQKSMFSLKLKELCQIYSAYVALFDKQLFDEAFLVDQVIEGLMHAPSKNEVTYIVEGFSSMTQQELDLLCALRGQAKTMAIRLVGGSEESVCLRYAKRLYQQVIDTFAASGWTVTVKEDKTRAPQAAMVFKQIFETAAEGVVGSAVGKDGATAFNSALQLAVANDRQQELAYVLLDMVKRHREEYMGWEEMAVLTNDLESYSAMAKRLFKAYRVPCFIDAKRPALTHFAIDFVISSVKSVLSGFRCQDVLKVLKTGFLVPYESVCRMENFALTLQLRGKRWLAPWEREDLADLEPHRALLMGYLEALKAGLKASANAQEMVVALRTYLKDSGCLQKLQEAVLEAKSENDFERAEEMAQIYNIIDHVLFQIHTLGNKMTLDLRDFFDLLKLGFESYEIGIIPPFQHFVTMGNIQRTRLSEVKRLYFVGMNEGVIPSRIDGKGLFQDEEMQWLVEQGIAKMRSTLYQYDEEVYKTYEHLLRAKGEVVWTFARFATDGVALKPSLWVTQLQDCGLGLLQASVDLADLQAFGLPAPYLDLCLEGFQAQSIPESLDFSGLGGLLEHPDYAQPITRYLQGTLYKNSPEPLPYQMATAIYGQSLKTSVTRLESFSKCPYQHFVRYALKPQKRETPDLTGLDMGDLFHHVLEALMNHLKDLPRPITADQWESFFDQIYDEKSVLNSRFDISSKNQYFKQRLKTVLYGAIKQVVTHINRGAFENYKNELVFGLGTEVDAPPLILETEKGDRIYLGGKIDRLDVLDQGDKAYLSIVDYKSSQQGLALSDVYHGLKLQLMLYLDVATAHGERLFGKETLPFGAFYFKVDEPMLQGMPDQDAAEIENERLEAFKLEGLCLDDPELIAQVDDQFKETGRAQVLSAKLKQSGELSAANHLLTPEALGTVMAYAKDKAQSIAESIFAGDITLAPVKEGQQKTCDYCDFKGICHFDDKKSQEGYQQPIGYDNPTTLEKMEETLLCHGQPSKPKPSL